VTTEIAQKVEKLFKLRPEFIFNDYYFNPAMAQELFAQVDFEELGLSVAQIEVETEDGMIIRSEIHGNGGLSLGSILLDGEMTQVRRKLVPIPRLLKFLKEAKQPLKEAGQPLKKAQVRINEETTMKTKTNVKAASNNNFTVQLPDTWV